MIVVATTVGRVDRLVARLRREGCTLTDAISPSPERRVVNARHTDWAVEQQLVLTLRGEGELAVLRPDVGSPAEAWRRSTRPITIDNRLTICPAWSDHPRDGLPGLIELGPGGFGSGSHPTTRMLIERLVETVRGAERVLDIGCGTGILALAALRLGAGTAVGVDLDDVAVKAAGRNAAWNELGDRFVASAASPADIDGEFEIVVANIARAAVVALAPALVARVAQGGVLLVSGLSPRQCDQVGAFLRPLTEVERRIEGDWAELVLACLEDEDVAHGIAGCHQPSRPRRGGRRF